MQTTLNICDYMYKYFMHYATRQCVGSDSFYSLGGNHALRKQMSLSVLRWDWTLERIEIWVPEGWNQIMSLALNEHILPNANIIQSRLAANPFLQKFSYAAYTSLYLTFVKMASGGWGGHQNFSRVRPKAAPRMSKWDYSNDRIICLCVHVWFSAWCLSYIDFRFSFEFSDVASWS